MHTDPIPFKKTLGGKEKKVVVGDGRLSILQGRYSNQNLGIYSEEEQLILNAAGSDPTSDINIYWVAGSGLDCYEWDNATNSSNLTIGSFSGWAGKAMKSSRALNDAYPRVVWVCPGPYDSYSFALHCVAHELGHALGDMGHTIDGYITDSNGLIIQKAGGIGYSPGSDNCQRLMTGLGGLRRNQLPALLNKAERDSIAIFFSGL